MVKKHGHNKIPITLSLLVSLLVFSSIASAATSLTYQYDGNGNLISGDGKYYEYNDANQLVRVRHGDAAGPVIAEYGYDYTGQRIKKIENGITTYYIGKHYEKQIDSAGSTINASYYFANGERVAKKDSFGNFSYYHLDHLGGTNVVTDSSGTLVERMKYYPFGEVREGGNEKYSFTGKEKDKQTDFYYFEARYYNPEFKHFTQADIVEPNMYNPQDLNRYAYVRNNPLKYIDPTGQSQIGTNEWNREFSNARINDREKFERMKKEYQIWVQQGGPALAAEAAYAQEYEKGVEVAWENTKEGSLKALDTVASLAIGDVPGVAKGLSEMSLVLLKAVTNDQSQATSLGQAAGQALGSKTGIKGMEALGAGVDTALSIKSAYKNGFKLDSAVGQQKNISNFSKQLAPKFYREFKVKSIAIPMYQWGRNATGASNQLYNTIIQAGDIR